MTDPTPPLPSPGPAADDAAAGLRPVPPPSTTTPGPPPGTVAGEIEILPAVVEKLAVLAAREMSGVVRLGAGGAWGALRRGVGGSGASGVTVELEHGSAAVALQVEIEYGVAAPELVRSLRDHVAAVVGGLAGLTVTRVDVTVTDVHGPDEPTDAPTAGSPG